jgi:DNA uptake protein ComE-like DNA-binding protein
MGILLQETRAESPIIPMLSRMVSGLRTWEHQMKTKFARKKTRTRLLSAFLACSLFAGMCGVTGATGRQSDNRTTVSPEARTDINSASVEELLTVPGMTRTWAGRIVRFRPYRSKDDLVERGVVTSEVYDRIKDHVIAHRAKQ